MNSGPLFARVAEEIKQKIRRGSISLGGYLPSVRQLQQDYDVSKNTVISALRSLQHEGIIAREGAARHGFRVVGKPEEKAHLFASDEASIYKMIMPFSFWNYAGSKLLEAIESAFGAEQIGLLFGNHGNDISQERELLERFLYRHQRAADALIIMTARSYDNPNSDLLRKIRERMPLLFIDRRVKGVPGHVLGINNRQIGATAAEIFLDKGYRSFGFLTGFWHVSSVRDRYGGFVTRLAEAGLTVDPRYFFPLDNVYAMELPLENAWEAMGERLSGLKKLPDAFFCASDKAAAALIRFCESRGLKVPGDVGIIGCDADEFVAPKIDRKITSFAYPFNEIARELARVLRIVREGEEHDTPGTYRSIELTPTFVPGETD
jgi:LacI family transcriptional regulator